MTQGVYDGEASQQVDDFQVVTEPSGPPKTLPTQEEADASRKARANGESVRLIAERFNKRRGTGWRYTKDIR